MPERLGDLAPVLLVECGPCGRRGSYRVCGLLARFGADCSLDHVRRHLTASCRWQTPPGLREGNQYHAKCQARLVLPEVRAPEPVRRAPVVIEPSHVPNVQFMRPFSGRCFKIDTWRGPEGSNLDLELGFIVPGQPRMAAATVRAAATLWPEARITARQDARLIAKWPEGEW